MSRRVDLREQIAAALYEAEARRLGYSSPLPDCVDPRRWLDSADALLPLVRAQVEAARRDALSECLAAIKGLRYDWLGDGRVSLSLQELSDTLTPFEMDRAARGETRQP